jgi:hypothetical protein
MFTIELKDLKVIIPIIIVIIGAIFSAGMFMQDKFICVDRVHDAIVKCDTDKNKAISELEIADKYISYLEADSNFNKNQTYQNYQLSADKKIDLQKNLKKYSFNPNTMLNKFDKLKEMKSEVDTKISAEVKAVKK